MAIRLPSQLIPETLYIGPYILSATKGTSGFWQNGKDKTRKIRHIIIPIMFWNMSQSSRGKTWRNLSSIISLAWMLYSLIPSKIMQEESQHSPLVHGLRFFKSIFPNIFLTLNSISVSILYFNSRPFSDSHPVLLLVCLLLVFLSL